MLPRAVIPQGDPEDRTRRSARRHRQGCLGISFGPLGWGDPADGVSFEAGAALRTRTHFALTPALSHSHPGSAFQQSFRGRGGDARRCRWVSRRSSSPTDARSVESGAPAGQAWRLPCGSPSNMDRPTPLRPQPKTSVREDPSTGWRERGPPCPLRWTWIKRTRIVGQPGIMDRQETDPVKIGSLRANDMHPDHVLKGHSWIAQGSSAALPWVAFQCRQSALKGLA